MTPAVVLAAGASVRLGEPKQLVTIAGETLLERAVRAAREAGCSPVVVVLGADAERIAEQCDLSDAVVVVNDAWSEGMASSIRVGVGALQDADGVVLMTCDQPAVSAAHLRALLQAFMDDPEIAHGKVLVGVVDPSDEARADLENRLRRAGAEKIKATGRFAVA